VVSGKHGRVLTSTLLAEWITKEVFTSTLLAQWIEEGFYTSLLALWIIRALHAETPRSKNNRF
jgi:hypothetical protein